MRSFLAKFFTIAALAVLLVIAGFMVRNVVADRIANRNVARQSIADSLANRQTLAGPLAVIRYTEHYTDTTRDKDGRLVDNGNRSETHVMTVLPDTLQLDGSLSNDPHYRGIFHINAYLLEGSLSGSLRLPALAELPRNRQDASISVDGVQLVVAISDPRGLRRVDLKVNDAPTTLEPGTQLAGLGNGVNARLTDASTLLGKPMRFALALALGGTENFSMIPLAHNTVANLKSEWPHPSFDGRFVPEKFAVTDKGFDAHWQISALASNARESFSCCDKIEMNQADSFSVSLIDPVDIYSMSDRASKYAELFIALTLGAFLLFELLRGLNLHPMNYLLISAALLIFFLLLLSLSERLGFAWAYLAAGGACVLLIGFYSAHLLRSLWLASGFTLGLGSLYAALYVILLSEQNALLMGSLLLFGLLACVMVGTRKVDWGSLLTSRKSATGNPEA
jgi:inner membrane protein